MENRELMQLAHSAIEKASDARHLADRAIEATSSHERICAERYAQIKDTMHIMQEALTSMNSNFGNAQSTMQNSINNLSNASHESIGKWKGISYISIAVGILWTVLKFAGVNV